MFICLFFVCLFVDLFVFHFNLCGTPTESSPENFVEIRLDLGSKNVFFVFCLFVCLLTKFHEDLT